MQCPVCPDTLLAITERQGIEIDYCPKCRGIWLDRGELDKLIERSLGASPASRPASPAPAPQQTYHPEGSHDFRYADFDRSHHPSGHYKPEHHYQKKKKSWLSELFDD